MPGQNDKIKSTNNQTKSKKHFKAEKSTIKQLIER